MPLILCLELMKMSELNEAIQKILREFDWGNYGFDEVEMGLHDYPQYQEWLRILADKIEAAIND